MAWEEFNKTHGRVRHGTITVRKGGTLAIAADIVKQLGSPKYIIFMFNETNWKIGIKAADDQYPSYPLRIMKNSVMSVVSGASFLRHYGLENIEKRQYLVEFENGMVTFYVGGDC